MPLLYFKVLLMCQDLFGQGITHIVHGMREMYYRFLCEMPPEAVAALHARSDLHKLRRLHYLALMRGDSLPILGPDRRGPAHAGQAPAHVASDSGSDAGDDGVDLGPAPVPEAPAIDPFKPFFVRGTIVKWDFCSHSSGVQRGYIRCEQHSACWRYAQISVHPSKQRLAAYLFAWRELGRYVDRATHVSARCQPEPAAVDALMEDVED